MQKRKVHIANNFEQALQKEADDYRMYPSDRVWDNIREELHGKPKWPALLITFTSVVMALIITTAIYYPPHSLFVKQSVGISTSTQQSVNALDASAKKNVANTSKIFVHKNASNILEDIPSFTVSINSNNLSKNLTNKDEVLNEKSLENNYNIENAKSYSEVSNSNLLPANNELFLSATMAAKNEAANKTVAIDETIENISTTALQPSHTNTATEVVKNENVDNYLNAFKAGIIKKKSKASRWQIQYYATISNSYRTLDDDKSRLSHISNPQERQALSANVNDVVKHKPALGGEFGVAFLYGISKRFFVKTGLQFNVRQYGIDAYRSDGNATFSYVQNNQLNTFSVKSAYSTQTGIAKENLQNQLYQVSVPVGLQWNIIDGERWGLSTAFTVQPTVTLNKNVYMVSTDYKNYADGTNFFRRSNINTSIELYLTLKSNGNHWFFGPQIRRQQMPTFHDIYPIKEYRVDYGIKFGFLKFL